MINEDRLLATFLDLVRIDNPSGGEERMIGTSSVARRMASSSGSPCRRRP